MTAPTICIVVCEMRVIKVTGATNIRLSIVRKYIFVNYIINIYLGFIYLFVSVSFPKAYLELLDTVAVSEGGSHVF